MWWAAGAARCWQVIQDRWCAGRHSCRPVLNGRFGVKAGAWANADGDPAADGMRVSLTVGRCNVERGAAYVAKRIFKE
jgi:hypothetical protein